ncbi:ATP-grasp fold amidoligase family protein [Ciceribacter sp. L1K22]|uniref:ATP-grasp fold amidoligase family protein n=1 Tax=Ciceribacter sp. L1K22 TaxID=2820275 RepID=UPI0032B223AE
MAIARKEKFKLEEIHTKGLGNLLRRIAWRLIAPLPDPLYVRLQYRLIRGAWPNLSNPVMFGEKVQARKLWDRNPLYATLVDKNAVKAWIAERVGAEHVLQVYWAGRDLKSVDWSTIPLPVVVKPNHASGLGRFIYTPEDVAELLADDPSAEWLAVNHYRYNREWAYSQVEPKMMIEQMLVVDGGIPADFRAFVFDGKISHFMVDIRHGETATSCAYGPDWTKLPFYDPEYFPHHKGEVPRPKQFEAMCRIASTLGRELDFARIDFFVSDDSVHVGEITLYPGGGYEGFEPKEWERVIGERWTQRLYNGR